MRVKSKIWLHKNSGQNIIAQIKEQLNVKELVAKILVNRGIETVEEAKEFLECDINKLSSPFEFSGMKKAVERIKKIILEKELIWIYGDYDVDGITSTALLYDLLKRLGANVDYYIPARLEEGYGLNLEAIKKAKEKNVKVIITVDCGISSIEEVTLAKELAIDVIITDHHEPGSTMPPAHAIINPKLEAKKTFDKLAGVGVAFKLAQAIHKELKLPKYENITAGEYLDLVALGTIADIVPLTGENRILVKHGLKMLESSWRPGLRAMISDADLTNKKITPGMVGFILAPRINAAGRIGSPSMAVDLLLSEDYDKALQIAQKLTSENHNRQEIESQIYRQAEEMIAKEINLDKEACIVLSSPDWHPGVIGIVASRIVEKYYRPTVMIAIDDGVGKGSARSIDGFNLYEAFSSCADLFTKFGGHEQAAGLTIAEKNISQFRHSLNQIAEQMLTGEDFIPKIKVDDNVKLGDIDTELLEQLEILAPFGFGNPNPVLSSQGVNVKDWKAVGKESQHLKITAGQEEFFQKCIGFNFATYKQLVATSDAIEMAYSVEKNNWQGRQEIQLIIKDLKPYFIPEERITLPKKCQIIDKRDLMDKIGFLVENINDRTIIYVHTQADKAELETKLKTKQSDLKIFIANQGLTEEQKKYCRHVIFYNFPLHWEDLTRIAVNLENIEQIYLLYNVEDCYNLEDLKQKKFPDREKIGALYRLLRTEQADNNTISKPASEFFNVAEKVAQLSTEEVVLAMTVLSQLSLINWEQQSGQIIIRLLPEPSEKLDLSLSSTYVKVITRRNQLDLWASFLLYSSIAEINRLFRQE